MHLYYICFLVGFAISAFVYCGLHFVFPATAVGKFVRSAPSPSILMAESREKWDNSDETVHLEIDVPKV
jgi:NCS1 family nucleobase:cation symporter-1